MVSVTYTCISLHIKTFECFTHFHFYGLAWLHEYCLLEGTTLLFSLQQLCLLCSVLLLCVQKRAILQPVTTRMRTNGHSIHPKKWKAIKNGKRKTPIFLEKKKESARLLLKSQTKKEPLHFFPILLWHRLKILANQGLFKAFHREIPNDFIATFRL